MDTWGLTMLAIARSHLPHIHALLMDIPSFTKHAHLAVAEPVHAPPVTAEYLQSHERALDQHLRTLDAGRLEQEFLPDTEVTQALDDWLGTP